MTIDDLLKEAERESRRELEQEALKAIELRARLPQLVEKALIQERERIAVELSKRSELSVRAIGDIVEQTPSWVLRAVKEEHHRLAEKGDE